jgi:hypothetical protein
LLGFLKWRFLVSDEWYRIITGSVFSPESGATVSDVRMLVDTGGEVTAIDSETRKHLDLKPVGAPKPFGGAMGDLSMQPVVRAGIEVAGKRRFFDAVVMPPQPGYEVILGQDFLRYCVLTYDGPASQGTIVIPEPPDYLV